MRLLRSARNDGAEGLLRQVLYIIAMHHFKYTFVFVVLCLLPACASEQPEPTKEIQSTISITSTVSSVTTRSCRPTLDDGVSPSYKPDMPERTVLGSGHVITGVVLSSVDCQPIANAKLEFWLEEEGLGHPDTSRATFFTNENGFYRFECNLPEHIHMRISAPGYKTIGVNSYHPEGEEEGVFDIVLVPE